jgi:hypothetical protein
MRQVLTPISNRNLDNIKRESDHIVLVTGIEILDIMLRWLEPQSPFIHMLTLYHKIAIHRYFERGARVRLEDDTIANSTKNWIMQYNNEYIQLVHLKLVSYI